MSVSAAKDDSNLTNKNFNKLSLSSAILALVCWLLSSCVSSNTTISALEVGEDSEAQADSVADIQQLVTASDGTTIAIPVRNPHIAKTQTASTLADADLSDAQSHVAEAQNDHVQTASDNSEALGTPQLALVVPQKNPLGNPQGILQANPEAIAAIDNSQADNGASGAVLPAVTAKHAPQVVRRPSFLARLFKRPSVNVAPSDDRNNKLLASSRTASSSNTELRAGSASLMKMPGVRPNAVIFGVSPQKTGKFPPIKLASAAGMARLSPLGLKTQHSGVNVSCIRPELLLLVNRIERHYGKKPTVTSGYRSPTRNRKAGGARNSMHIYCKAVDIQVEGISKWDLAKYMRTMPGRGGVGTYCRTKSVHIDIGPKRDWHYSCRRKSKRRRKT